MFTTPFGRLSTAILRCPTGIYTIVGSIPGQLTEPDPRAMSPGQRRSLRFATEQAAIDALLAIGCTRFQLADCSWYQPDASPAEVAATLTEMAAVTAQDAPPLAECPFTLSAPVAEVTGHQRRLF